MRKYIIENDEGKLMVRREFWFRFLAEWTLKFAIQCGVEDGEYKINEK